MSDTDQSNILIETRHFFAKTRNNFIRNVNIKCELKLSLRKIEIFLSCNYVIIIIELCLISGVRSQ